MALVVARCGLPFFATAGRTEYRGPVTLTAGTAVGEDVVPESTTRLVTLGFDTTTSETGDVSLNLATAAFFVQPT